ncbi:MAG: hypothetical protein Q4C04_04475 [Clostridia bacterium]|nr:hypothetical protein [Clostridia bacterium]
MTDFQRGVTLPFTIDVGIDLSTSERLFIIFEQGSFRIEKTKEDVVFDGTTISAGFSEQEALSLPAVVKVQVVVVLNGSRLQSDIVSFAVKDTLLEREVLHE